MRILTKKNIYIFSILTFSGITVSAQNNPKNSVADSLINQFITQKIDFGPQQEATVTINEDPRIKRLADLKIQMEKEGKFSDRYKVQLYNGSLNKANEIIKKAQEIFPDWPSTIKYETPDYKVWIGNFRTKLEADRAHRKILEEFPNAIRFKPREL
ncbi:SPOR domain-containing protein [Aquimarina brevivitae]|uniref:Sporulation related protein n=1 Tax=Aquimarina brevivitae TaxID=323412 RepID=A0A4Q7PFC8_9FLAO|nr:SPOR domain-containing protein [Aquimarina brevivitae]RZS98877.1 hypothetical protein EV197_0077 [Aquimarina brevivitae]